jgi:hypothetical protein
MSRARERRVAFSAPGRTYIIEGFAGCSYFNRAVSLCRERGVSMAVHSHKSRELFQVMVRELGLVGTDGRAWKTSPAVWLDQRAPERLAVPGEPGAAEYGESGEGRSATERGRTFLGGYDGLAAALGVRKK